jgi:WD40 repeat protein
VLSTLIILGAAVSARAELPSTNLQPPGTHGGFFGFAISPDGKTVAGGTGVITVNDKPIGGGEAVLWDARTGKLKKTLGAHGDSVNWLAWSRDGKVLASGSLENGVVKIWDLPAGKLRKTITIKGKIATRNGLFPALCLTSDAKLIIAALARETRAGNATLMVGSDLQAWDAQTGKEKWTRPEANVRHFAVSPDSRTLASYVARVTDLKTTGDGSTTFNFAERQLLLLSAQSGEPGKSFPLEKDFPDVVMFTPDGTLIAGMNNAGMILWNPETGKPEGEVKWDRSRWACNACALSSDGKRVARAWSDWVELTDVASGKVIGLQEFRFPGSIFNPAFAADLKGLACSQQAPVLIDLSKIESAGPK